MRKQKPCTATITFTKDGKQFTQKCCLLSPHIGLKHYNPNLLITCGGEAVTKDISGNDITKTWSPYCNSIQV